MQVEERQRTEPQRQVLLSVWLASAQWWRKLNEQTQALISSTHLPAL